MIGKPYPLLRRCWTCSHTHAAGQSCDDARRQRWAAFVLDLALAFGGAFAVGSVAYALHAVLA